MLRGCTQVAAVKVGAHQQGFTIIELMFATIVFSTIMVLASATVVRFTNNFQRGLTQTATQNTARSVIDELSDSLQTAGASDVIPSLPSAGSSSGICIKGVRYSFILNQPLENTRRVLVKEEGAGTGCGAMATNIASTNAGQELMGEHMRLVSFSVTPKTGGGGTLYDVAIKIAYGDDDLFNNVTNPDTIACKGGAGSQFCAVTGLSTTIKRRV